ncbi:unnamed protein product [Musa acuminata subsp. malaccensis]|uniref:(wild Malaysian banana) hypothetical protein n=1 Tax=Musa acuminata subsp. malaccensis TaxID=214687 RepID=A0A804J0S4_MUSAM|nr:unnamed protein product [Musa acuminata subsp. malaccensis]
MNRPSPRSLIGNLEGLQRICISPRRHIDGQHFLLWKMFEAHPPKITGRFPIW